MMHVKVLPDPSRATRMPQDDTIVSIERQALRVAQSYSERSVQEGERDDVAAGIELPIPPSVEQSAIVAKIEALFSELDHGVEQLEAVQAQLKRYRQAVLKAAFEGKLAADWRAEQQKQGKLPTADELLAKIKQERAERYEKQLADWKQAVKDWEAAGGKDSGDKKPRKPAKPKDYPSLSQSELSQVPDLPEGWLWCRLETISDISGGLTKNAKRKALPLKLPYLRVANVYSGRLKLDVIKEIGVTEADREKTELKRGDLLFVEGNGSADQIGRVAVWDGSIEPCLHQNHLIRCRPLHQGTTQYLLSWFLSPDGRDNIMREASSTSGLHTLSISKVSLLAVPLAPLEEQRMIAEELDSKLSLIDQLERSIVEALSQATALKQSILKKAFAGQLLDKSELNALQADSAYEPANQLLERIRADREKTEAKNPIRSRKKKPTQPARKITLPKGERYRQAAHAAYAVGQILHRTMEHVLWAQPERDGPTYSAARRPMRATSAEDATRSYRSCHGGRRGRRSPI